MTMYIIITGSTAGICQRICHPEITDFSYTYHNINWNAPVCSNSPVISQYQLFFAYNSEGDERTYFTNETSFRFNLDYLNCSDICLFRVKAQFEDNTESHFSSCLKINDEIQEKKCK